MSATSDTEVEGSIVHLIHVDDSDTEPMRTVLMLASRDDMSFTVEEEEADFNPAAQRRTRRYRTSNTIDFELSSAINVDMEALELLGIVDTDGALTFDTDSRRLRPADDEYIELGYFNAEGADYADAELVHRFEDVESASPEIDLSETPPVVSWTMWIHGAVQFAYTESV